MQKTLNNKTADLRDLPEYMSNGTGSNDGALLGLMKETSDPAAEKILEIVSGNLGSGYECGITLVIKRGDRKLTGIQARLKGTKIAPTIYISDEASVEHNAEYITSAMMDYFEAPDKMGIADLSDSVGVWKESRKKLFPMFVSTVDNQEYLETVISVNLTGGISCIFFVKLNEEMRVTVTPGLLKGWDVSKADLISTALENIKQNKVSSRNMAEVLTEMGMPVPGGGESPMVVVNGSTEAFLDTSEFQRLAEKMDSDLYILPSSIHELIIVNKDEDTQPATLLEMIHEVNESQVQPDERLSNCLFVYSRDSGKLAYISANNQVVGEFNPLESLQAA